jgi:Immunity protein 8
VTIVAKLKRLGSTDTPSLETFQPDGPFGIYIFAMVGPAGSAGEESFGITVCTPEWFAENMKNNVVSGRHHLFVKEYNYEELKSFMIGYWSRCMGNSWAEVAQKVSRIGYWEFEGYEPYAGPT